MAYNSNNYNKWVKEVIKLYNDLKTPDVPDTEIIRREFPRHNIYLSYRQWMNIKGRPVKREEPTNQLNLFAEFARL